MVTTKLRRSIAECNRALVSSPCRYVYIPLKGDASGAIKTKAVYGEDFLIAIDTMNGDGTLKTRDIREKADGLTLRIINNIIAVGDYSHDLYVTSRGIVYDGSF